MKIWLLLTSSESETFSDPNFFMTSTVPSDYKIEHQRNVP